MVFGYMLMVCFKWSPQTEGHLKALALPVWAVLLLYIGECVYVSEHVSESQQSEISSRLCLWKDSSTSKSPQAATL